MHYVYVLESAVDLSWYVGCTKDLKKRFRMHNSGQVRSTKDLLPFSLIHYEMFLHQSDAYEREKFLKTGWGRTHLKKLLGHYLRG